MPHGYLACGHMHNVLDFELFVASLTGVLIVFASYMLLLSSELFSEALSFKNH
jgi:hypothetical protein